MLFLFTGGALRRQLQSSEYASEHTRGGVGQNMVGGKSEGTHILDAGT